MTTEAAEAFGNVSLPSTGGEGNHDALMGKTFKILECSDRSPKKRLLVDALGCKTESKVMHAANLRLSFQYYYI